jgi:hypothetical protein
MIKLKFIYDIVFVVDINVILISPKKERISWYIVFIQLENIADEDEVYVLFIL